MSWQLVLTLAAAASGFVAALFFAAATAFSSKKKLVAIARTYLDFNLEIAKAAVSQSTQYLIGSLLLLASFCFQVAAVLVNSSTTIVPLPTLLSMLGIIVFAVLVIASLAYCLYVPLYRWRLSQVEKELRKPIKLE
jgi:hypothetical protein